MIEKDMGFFSLICDVCGDESGEPFDEFSDAVDFKKDKENGWISRRDKNGNWEDVCPDCQKEAETQNEAENDARAGASESDERDRAEAEEEAAADQAKYQAECDAQGQAEAEMMAGEDGPRY